MADIPIIFSAPMIRALLYGRKTMTRRVLKPQPQRFAIDDKGTPCDIGVIHVEGDPRPRISLGRVITKQEIRWATGDRLYVRENWQALSFGDYRPTKTQPCDVRFAATDPLGDADKDVRGYSWRPSIHMPRWASRLTLLVEAVKVERLQEISEEDAKAEGIPAYVPDDAVQQGPRWYRMGFEDLWNSLHGDGSWESNPEVVAISFRVEKRNIDHREAAA